MKVTEKENELLTMLMEEAAEIIHACAKIKRHGFGSFHPKTGVDNSFALAEELKDFLCILDEIESQEGSPIFVIGVSDLSNSLDLPHRFDHKKSIYTHYQHPGR